MATMNDEPDIEWFRADRDAEWLAGSTADTAERNLARAFRAMREAERSNTKAFLEKQAAKAAK